MPPAKSKVIITNPSNTLQSTICLGRMPSVAPPETMVLITSTAESAEVTR